MVFRYLYANVVEEEARDMVENILMDFSFNTALHTIRHLLVHVIQIRALFDCKHFIASDLTLIAIYYHLEVEMVMISDLNMANFYTQSRAQGLVFDVYTDRKDLEEAIANAVTDRSENWRDFIFLDRIFAEEAQLSAEEIDISTRIRVRDESKKISDSQSNSDGGTYIKLDSEEDDGNDGEVENSSLLFKPLSLDVEEDNLFEDTKRDNKIR